MDGALIILGVAIGFAALGTVKLVFGDTKEGLAYWGGSAFYLILMWILLP